jgi:uncharacterized Tic20 family protein
MQRFTRLTVFKKKTMEEIKTYTQSERDWAMFCHLSSFACFFFPLGGIIGPLICWISRKDESAWVNSNGKASLNFQISILLYVVLSIPLCFILVGIPIIIFLWILKIVCVIVASVRASKGEYFKYPLAIPFLQ